jgi:DNA-binding NarL/FixJ family response regulator
MLRGTRPPAPASVPRLILLDVASAASGCLGFLKELRQDPALKASSVFVLSSQPSAQNLQEAYELNVAGFIKNPLGLESLAGGIATLHAFWNLMELPN